MKNATNTPRKTSRRASALAVERVGRIHPVIIYPYRQPKDYGDLEALYGMVGRLAADPDRYARPLTVVDRKTHFAPKDAKAFAVFRRQVVEPNSTVLETWSVDTCQMWYTGLGEAFQHGRNGDVYWLIPGDFNYGTPIGHEVLSRLHDLPEIIAELKQDLCVGEIATDHCNSKQLIDTYGTFALLYNWFPAEAQEIRQFTERPRSEFFAIRHQFLREVLAERWYPYEQTVVMLLLAAQRRKKISRFFVGNVSDLPEGCESLASAMQQVERTERVLKTLWRDRNEYRKDWIPRYRDLEMLSEQIRRTAFRILRNLLGEGVDGKPPRPAGALSQRRSA